MREAVRDFVARMRDQFNIKGDLLDVAVGSPEASVRDLFSSSKVKLHELLQNKWTDFHGDITRPGLGIPDASLDGLLLLETIEHVRSIFSVLPILAPAIKKDGIILITTHCSWPIHQYPCDYWRIMPDGMLALTEPYFDMLELELEGDQADPKGIWYAGRRL